MEIKELSIKDIEEIKSLFYDIFTKEPWKNDKHLFILSLVGLTLSGLIAIAPILDAFILFYCIALYFSVIWGLFFYYLFKTDQVKLKTTIILFFATQVITTLIFFVFNIIVNVFISIFNS